MIFLVKKLYVLPHFNILILSRHMSMAIHTYIERTKAKNIYAEVLTVVVYIH